MTDTVIIILGGLMAALLVAMIWAIFNGDL